MKKYNDKELKQLALKLTHSSCAIENNTYTLEETRELIFHNKVVFWLFEFNCKR